VTIFKVNVMVPSGANPHVYEPFPEQVNQLRKSVAYISNGFLGFEMTWLDRFYQVNKTMIKMSPGEKIKPIASSMNMGMRACIPKVLIRITGYLQNVQCNCFIVLELLCTLNPGSKEEYKTRYAGLLVKIGRQTRWRNPLFRSSGKAFMIFHPNLAYLARDYGLQEIAVEFEGKEPPPQE